MIVVSLQGASENPEHEDLVRETFEQEYQSHYLGVVPLLLSTELTRRADDHARTATAVMNAYLHRDWLNRPAFAGDSNL